jgi:hypothetical protein
MNNEWMRRLGTARSWMIVVALAAAAAVWLVKR